MTETIFKFGDKVFDIRYGWGEVIEIKSCETYSTIVRFKNSRIKRAYHPNGYCTINSETPLLSFTEYTLEGFSDERPIDYSEYSGDWGKFWNGENKDYNWVISRLLVYNPDEDSGKKFTSMVGLKYEFFEPLTDEQIKILGLDEKV